MQQTKHKLLIILTFFSGWLCFAVSPQSTGNSPRISIEKHHPWNAINQKREPQAKGVILSFYKRSSKNEQNKISQTLTKEGLKLTKKFKSFKSLVFSWPQLQSERKAQNICKRLSYLKNLKYCEPDILLHPHSSAKKSKTEADTFVCTVNCNDQQQSPAQKNLSKLQDTLNRVLPLDFCEILPTKHNLKEGTLTDYWAQEMVGADLLREEIEKAIPLPKDKFLIAVFDSPKTFSDHPNFSNPHATYVENIISHRDPQAVLPPLNSLQLQSFPVNFPSSYIEAVYTLENIPSFINNSLEWSNSQNKYDTLSEISPPAILVTASGNAYPNHPHIDPMKSKFSKDFDGIIVGSLSPNGAVSDFSQEGEEVYILAPSDHHLTSIDDDGNYAKFGGSSGSAPLVTGALAGFEWLSGYHPTPKEAKLLLENTAVPTVHSVFENPQKNGVGMLNAYKLGQVAKRLKDKCNNDNHCFKREIQNLENYQFSTDQSVLEETQNFFPNCSNRIQSSFPHASAHCTEKKSALKKLRQAVLLDTTNVELWRLLYCIYKQEGFSENALGVERTLFAITKNKDFLNDIGALWSSWSEKSRLFSLVDRHQKVKFFNELLDNNPSEQTRMNIAIEAGEIGGSEALQLLERLVEDPSERVRAEVAWYAVEIGGSESLTLIEPFAEDPSPIVRQAVIQSAVQIEGNKSLTLIEPFAKDSSPIVRKEVALSAGKIGGSESLTLLEPFAEDPSPDVRRAFVRSAGQIGGHKSFTLIEPLAEDPSPTVRKEVVWYVGLKIRGNETEVRKLLERLAQDSSKEVAKAALERLEIFERY